MIPAGQIQQPLTKENIRKKWSLAVVIFIVLFLMLVIGLGIAGITVGIAMVIFETVQEKFAL